MERDGPWARNRATVEFPEGILDRVKVQLPIPSIGGADRGAARWLLFLGDHQKREMTRLSLPFCALNSKCKMKFAVFFAPLRAQLKIVWW